MQFFECLVGSFGLPPVVSNIDEVEIQGVELGASLQASDHWRFCASANCLEELIPAPDFGGPFDHPGGRRRWGWSSPWRSASGPG